MRHRRLGRRRGGLVLVLVSGGLAVGLLAQLATAFGVPATDVLFSGQESIPALVSEPSVVALIVLVVAKAIAYMFTLASGFRGGAIFPALFLGVGLAAFPVHWFGLSSTAAIAIGAAAGMAAQTRLVVTSMLFAALLVGSAGRDAIAAAVFATVAAYLVASGLDPRPQEPAPAAPEASASG
jgi:H+/Cl- antiporter ClcA